jgi:hypothetical protein
MRHRNSSVLLQMLPVLLAVAIVGYLLGGNHSSAGPRAASPILVVGTAAVPNPVVLEYPSTPSWPLSGAPKLPGLTVAQSLTLAPGGNAHGAGLVAGQISAEIGTPLPAPFLARLHEVPTAEVVSLFNTQAYRYGHLFPSGSNDELTLYAIPGMTGSTDMIACYAAISPETSTYLKACEQLAGKLRLQVEGESEILPPDVTYARQIGEVVARVDKLRLALRSAMSQQAAPATQARAALRLADGFGEASRSLALIQASPAARWAQTGVSQRLAQAHDSYVALATAARADRPSDYKLARTLVYGAEARIVAALKRYALVGYQ